MILFIIAQLFINFKRGMVFSPFYHYGMYSEVMNVHVNYTVFEVEANRQTLKAQDFSPRQWDKIILPLNYYSIISKSNALYQTDIKRLMNKILVFSNEKNFLQNCDSDSFNKWYKSYLESMMHEKIVVLNIRSHTYQFKSGHLQATNSYTLPVQACN